MDKKLFDVLLAAVERDSCCRSNISDIANKISKDNQTDESVNSAIKQGLLAYDGSITSKGYNALSPYKVDNAIIMAAGLSHRCSPLSQIVPKGLFVVKGEV